jgi:hypothetical protein
LAELKSSSPFAAVKVSCSFAVIPPMHAADEPVTVIVFANVVVPKCSKWPVPVTVTWVADVAMKLPEKLPLKGLEWEAKTTGNAPSSTRPARMAGITTNLFVIF